MDKRAVGRRMLTQWWARRHFPQSANPELVRLGNETPLVELITTKHWKESWVILLMRNGIYTVEGLQRALAAEHLPHFRYASTQLISELWRMREKAAKEASDG